MTDTLSGMQLRSTTGKTIPVAAHTQLGRSLDPRLPAVISRELAILTVSSDQQCELKASKPISIIRKEQSRADQRQVLCPRMLQTTCSLHAARLPIPKTREQV